MQSVNVLRTEKQFTGAGLFAPLGQGNMRGIGFSIEGAGATIRVILPNQGRVLLPGFNICQFVMAVAAPVGPLKDRDTTFSAEPRRCQDEELRCRAERGTCIVFAVLTDH